MKKTLLTYLTLLMLYSTIGWGQIVQFDFPASNSLVCSSKDVNLVVSDMTLSTGTIETNITTGTYFLNEPYIEETAGWTATTQSEAKSFTFTITANSGFNFSISNISFNAYATAAGPSAFSAEIDGTSISSINAPSATLVNYSQAVSKTGLSSAIIKIQGWLNGSRTSTGAGVFRLDDLIINGTVSSSGASTVAISSASSLTESNLNGAQITLALTSETFVASPGTSDFTLNNAPAGTTISGVTRNSDTGATLTLAFDGTDFDSDIANFTVTAGAAALTGGSPLTSNALSIDAYTAPIATTNAATSTLNGNATLNGTVTSNGYTTTIIFEYGTDTSYGTDVTASQSPLTSDASSATVSYSLSGLTNGQVYHYRVKAINSEGTIFGIDQTFTPVVPPSIFISEIGHPSNMANAKFVEIYNYSGASIDLSALSVYLVIQANGGTYSNIALTGTVVANGTYVVAYNDDYFLEAFEKTANIYSGNVTGNGDDGYFLYVGGNETTGTMFDAYGIPGEDGTGKTWEYTNSKAVRKTTVSAPNASWTASEWNIVGAATSRMSPGAYPASVWNGSADASWANALNWDNGLVSSTMDAYIWGGATNFPDLTSSVTVNNLVLQHSAQINGQEKLTVNGTVTVNHQITKSTNATTLDHWQYFATPFSDNTAGSLLSTNDKIDIFTAKYDNSLSATINNAWSFISSSATSLSTGKGYAVTYVNDASESGLTISGTDYNMNLTGTLINTSSNASVALTQGLNNWNLIGNPYLAPINWFDDTNLNFSNIQGSAAYVYNPATSSYIAITSTGSGTGTISPAGSALIPPMQGFFVEASSPGTFDLDLDARVNTAQSFYKSEPLVSMLKIKVVCDSVMDETAFFLNEIADNAFDKNDAHKLFSNGTIPQIYSTTTDGHQLVFNHLNNFTDNVQLKVQTKRAGRYNIELSEILGDFNNYQLILTNEQGLAIDLSKSSYQFEAGEGNFTHVFELSLLNATAVQNSPLNKAKVYSIGKEIFVKSSVELNGEIRVFSVNGKKIHQERIDGKYANIQLYNESGIMLVQIVSENQISTFKVSIK